MLQLEWLGPVLKVKGWGDGCELISGVLKMRVMRAEGARHSLWEACGDRALPGGSADLSSLVWVPAWFRQHTHQAVQAAASRCLWGHDARQAGLEPGLWDWAGHTQRASPARPRGLGVGVLRSAGHLVTDPHSLRGFGGWSLSSGR